MLYKATIQGAKNPSNRYFLHNMVLFTDVDNLQTKSFGQGLCKQGNSTKPPPLFVGVGEHSILVNLVLFTASHRMYRHHHLRTLLVVQICPVALGVSNHFGASVASSSILRSPALRVMTITMDLPLKSLVCLLALQPNTPLL